MADSKIMQGLMQAVSVAYVPMTRCYWATSAAGHVTVIDPRGPARVTDYVRNARQATLDTLHMRFQERFCQLDRLALHSARFSCNTACLTDRTSGRHLLLTSQTKLLRYSIFLGQLVECAPHCGGHSQPARTSCWV